MFPENMPADLPDPYYFRDEVWVICPKCGSRAIAKTDKVYCTRCSFQKLREKNSFTPLFGGRVGAPSHETESQSNQLLLNINHRVALTRCGGCGQTIRYPLKASDKYKKNLKVQCNVCQRVKVLVIHHSKEFYQEPYDPYFRLPLWLQAAFKGKVLWAYNLEHLLFLKRYLKQKLRPPSIYARGFISCLPAWLKSAKHRDSLLKVIKNLEQKN